MPGATHTFPALGQSVGGARRHAVSVLDRLSLQRLQDDLRVVVSELATNAVLHARTPFTLTLALHPHHLRVAVADASPALPRPNRLHDQNATTGRGLLMVAQLSTAWGIDPDPGGKTVWCDLPLHPEPPPQQPNDDQLTAPAQDHDHDQDQDNEAPAGHLGAPSERARTATLKRPPYGGWRAS